MADIGIKHFVYAKISSYTPGSAVTYATGKPLAAIVNVDATLDHRSVEFWADDELQDFDDSISGYTVSFEHDDIELTDLADFYGETAHMTGAEGSQTVESYEINDAVSPEVGFGFVTCKRKRGVLSYEGWWFRRCKFTRDGINGQTKQKDIAFNPEKSSGTGMSVVVDNTGVPKYVEHMRFTTEAAAIAFVNGRAGYTPAT